MGESDRPVDPLKHVGHDCGLDDAGPDPRPLEQRLRERARGCDEGERSRCDADREIVSHRRSRLGCSRCGYRSAACVVLLPMGDAGLRSSFGANLALQAEEAHPGIGREDPLADGNVPA